MYLWTPQQITRQRSITWIINGLVLLVSAFLSQRYCYPRISFSFWQTTRREYLCIGVTSIFHFFTHVFLCSWRLLFYLVRIYYRRINFLLPTILFCIYFVFYSCYISIYRESFLIANKHNTSLDPLFYRWWWWW